MREIQRRVDEVRASRTEIENHVIDAYTAGKISRREFVRRGTVLGMSLPVLSFLAAACGGDEEGGGERPRALCVMTRRTTMHGE
jgi:peptide/nickel transport system substrate-binding protein